MGKSSKTELNKIESKKTESMKTASKKTASKKTVAEKTKPAKSKVVPSKEKSKAQVPGSAGEPTSARGENLKEILQDRSPVRSSADHMQDLKQRLLEIS